MSDSSGFDSPRSRHRSEDPNALQRLPSTNSTEVKEMWNDVANARPKEPSPPREDWRPFKGRAEHDSQDPLLRSRRTRDSGSSSRPSSAVGHDLARTDSDAPSWTSAHQQAHTNGATADYCQDWSEQAKPGPPVDPNERNRAFVPLAKYRIKNVARKVLNRASAELGSNGERRMASRRRKYNTQERQEEYERDAQRREAYLRERAHSSRSLDLLDSD
ncbi:hypothetical protein BJY59DRAFT_685506 [Rhodotorula toruloides]